MKTEIFVAKPLLSEVDLNTVVMLLRNGRLVAIPTETVYGLAADFFQEGAVQKIFHAKGRPTDKPLIAHISALWQVERLIACPSTAFLCLAEKFWPGPLTLVATHKGKEISPLVSAGFSTIGVRMPSHPCARQIITAVGFPLAVPSANLSGRPSPTSATEVLEDFSGCIPVVVDGGPSPLGIESTVLDLVDEEHPVLLRSGAIPRGEIEDVLKKRLQDPKPGRISSMKYRRCTPKAEVRVIEDLEQFQQEIAKDSVYALTDCTSKNFYSHLRQADREGYSKIAILLTESMRVDEALMSRLNLWST